MNFASSLKRSKRRLLWDISKRLDGIEIVFDQLLEKVDVIMSYKEDLMEIVEKEENLKVAVVTYIDSNNARIDKLEADLLAAIGSNAAVDALVRQAKEDINADAEVVFAKLTANTPAAEPPAEPA